MYAVFRSRYLLSNRKNRLEMKSSYSFNSMNFMGWQNDYGSTFPNQRWAALATCRST